MSEILLARRVPPVDYMGVRGNFKGKLSAVCRTAEECEGLVRWFGSPDFCPNLPIMVIVPGAPAPTLIPGFGYATAAELRDCAVAVWYQQTERLTKTGKMFNYDELRERSGLMRREEVDPAVREAMLRRIEQHKANPLTDPPRQPVYQNPTNRKVYGKE